MSPCIIEVDSIPAGAKTIRTYWWCARFENEVRTIDKYAAVEAFKKGSDKVFIRCGMHPNTYQMVQVGCGNGSPLPLPLHFPHPQKVAVPDPDGDHFTAEMQRRDKGWVTWHQYFKFDEGEGGGEGGEWRVNEEVSPNPKYFVDGSSSKSTTQDCCFYKVPVVDKVHVYQRDKTYFVQVVQNPQGGLLRYFDGQPQSRRVNLMRPIQPSATFP